MSPQLDQSNSSANENQVRWCETDSRSKSPEGMTRIKGVRRALRQIEKKATFEIVEGGFDPLEEMDSGLGRSCWTESIQLFDHDENAERDDQKVDHRVHEEADV